MSSPRCARLGLSRITDTTEQNAVQQSKNCHVLISNFRQAKNNCVPAPESNALKWFHTV